jgi:hypothetical protein
MSKHSTGAVEVGAGVFVQVAGLRARLSDAGAVVGYVVEFREVVPAGPSDTLRPPRFNPYGGGPVPLELNVSTETGRGLELGAFVRVDLVPVTDQERGWIAAQLRPRALRQAPPLPGTAMAEASGMDKEALEQISEQMLMEQADAVGMRADQWLEHLAGEIERLRKKRAKERAAKSSGSKGQA